MTDKRLYGVGGWLGLLVVGLTFLGPMLSFGSTYGEIKDTEGLYPQLIGTSLWEQIIFVTWSVLALQIFVSVTAGFRLTQSFKPSSVHYAIFALWFGGIGITVIAYFLLSSIAGFDADAADAELIQGLVRGTITAGIWTAYLLMSRRVKNTYYAKEAEPNDDSPRETTKLRFRDRWQNVEEGKRKVIFFVLCWIALILAWAWIFDDSTTEFFQEYGGLDWRRIWTWALIPPAFILLASWVYRKLVSGDVRPNGSQP